MTVQIRRKNVRGAVLGEVAEGSVVDLAEALMEVLLELMVPMADSVEASEVLVR